MASNISATALDQAFSGAGDAQSAFIMKGLFGASINSAIECTMVTVVIQALLTAYALTKAYEYLFVRPSQDPLWVKGSVWLLVFFAISSMVIVNVEFHYLWRHRFDIKDHVQNTVIVVHLILGVIHYSLAVVQGYFGYKAYLLWDRQVWILIVNGISILSTFVVSTITDVVGVRMPAIDWPNVDPATAIPLLTPWGLMMQHLIRTVTFLIFFGELFVTIMITVGLLRKKTEWKSTTTLINRAVILMTEAMMPPLLCHIASIIMVFLNNAALVTSNVLLCGIIPSIHLSTLVITLLGREGLKSAAGQSGLQSRHAEGGTRRSRFGTKVDPIRSMVKGDSQSRSDDDGEYHVLTARPVARMEPIHNERMTNGVIIETDEFVTVDKEENVDRKNNGPMFG